LDYHDGGGKLVAPQINQQISDEKVRWRSSVRKRARFTDKASLSRTPEARLAQTASPWI